MMSSLFRAMIVANTVHRPRLSHGTLGLGYVRPYVLIDSFVYRWIRLVFTVRAILARY